MKIYRRILCSVAVLALVSGSTLVVSAQDRDQPQDQVQMQDQGPAQDQTQDQSQDGDQGQMTQDRDQGRAPEDQAAPPPLNDRAPNDYPQNDQPLNDQPRNDQPQGDPRNDPPARAARLQFTEGSVSVQPHGTDDWVTGAINRPLTNADNIWADKNSRAEINVGTALIRIDSESSLTLTNIGENMVQLQLHQGAMNLHVRRLYDGESYEVDTPNQAFTVLKPGDYRFDVNPDADKTIITVWRGEGEASGQGPAVRVRENEQARFSDGNSMTHDIHAAPSPDGFDEWAQSRDGRLDHSASSRYVSPDVVGSEDLDEYGSWRDVPQYGNIWVPSQVGVGWAPYRYGHWIWVAPWGWTWVEDEPWGYAPFHYGRWVYYNNYWGWAPGPIYARPYYSPALVAFYGGGGWGVGLGFGFGGGYGWCPLGFGEPFIPWYGVSRGYFNRVNITNTRITNINNVYNTRYINRGGLHGGEPMHYANMRAPNGFTAVSRDTMVNSRSVARNNVRVSPNELSRMSPTRTLDARPTRTTMLGANAGRTTAMPPPRSFARPVVGRNTAASVRGGSGYSARDNMRTPERGSAMSRSVPRPPSAGGMSPQARAQGMDRGTNARPTYSQRSPGYAPRNEGSNSRGNSAAPRSYEPRSGGPRSEVAAPPSMRNAAPRGYSSAAERGSYSGPSNSRSSYGGGRPSSPSYGGYGRPAPSYGGAYSRPATSRPAPSYDRGSYGRSAPSYGGGRASGGYSGGGRPSGGGRASAPSHSSGGGGGGSRTNGSHGRH